MCPILHRRRALEGKRKEEGREGRTGALSSLLLGVHFRTGEGGERGEKGAKYGKAKKEEEEVFAKARLASLAPGAAQSHAQGGRRTDPAHPEATRREKKSLMRRRTQTYTAENGNCCRQKESDTKSRIFLCSVAVALAVDVIKV